MREYINNLLGTSKGSNHHVVLDAASGRRLLALNLLHEKFTDKEVVMILPDRWNSHENRESVEEINGAGVFEQFGVFNPNNHTWMALTWMQEEVAAIFVALVMEYHVAMDKTNWLGIHDFGEATCTTGSF